MLSELVLTIFSGGATGIMGSLINKFTNLWDKKLDHKFILAKYELDAKIRAQESDNLLISKKVKYQTQMLQASYQHDIHHQHTSLWVNNIRSLIRPILTLLLWLIVILIWFNLPDMVNYQQIITTILYAATTATTWWFGDRYIK